jgi:two-component system sensor histidine kinase FlrB
MKDTLQLAMPTDPGHLAGAFELFVQASQALELQYAQLQEKVTSLNADLISANERLRVVLDSLPAAVLVIEDEVISHFNAAAKELLPTLSPGMAWEIPDLWQPGSGPDEYLIPVHNGRSQTWQIQRADAQGRSVIQIQDITANLQTLEASERMDRLAAMGQMSAGIAHQIRTPLATALLYASHLKDAELPSENRLEFATKLQSRLIHLEKLASDMLQFIKGKPLQTQPVAVSELLNECCLSIHGLLEAKKQTIHRSNPWVSTDVWVDRPATVSALVAVLENAIEISPAGASIILETVSQNQLVHMVITDQGPGIAADMLACLFEPFATNRNHGTGLGLAIALNAVRAHGGDIMAQNMDQGGARFTITLPIMNTQKIPT